MQQLLSPGDLRRRGGGGQVEEEEDREGGGSADGQVNVETPPPRHPVGEGAT